MEGATTHLQQEGGKPKDFTFDFSYFWDTEQERVYTDLAKPIVEAAMTGYNGTIFAYGQTGSGKTWSMMGSPEQPGIIPQLNQDLFVRIAEAENDANQFLVLVSYLEIYNEVVKDLLNPSDRQLKIREHPEMGIYVESLAELVVKSADDVVKLLEQGNKVRQVAATQMNERSSRSHSCFIIKVEQKFTEEIGDIQRETALTSKINLVDLAGSERAAKTGASGDRLKEGAAINKSLSALGNVINALAEGKTKFVPYRDSKLTRLLQQSLGGNSRTVMIATISPADDNFDESISTLSYANRAKNIKNTAKRNEDVNEKVIRELREEIEMLREQLAAAQTGGGGGGGGGQPMSDEKVQQMEEMIANLERAKMNSWGEKQRLSELYEEERQKNLANPNKIRSVMQTIKEDNKELMKRMRHLVQQKQQLTREFRKEKDKYMAVRTELADSMSTYQTLYADGGEDGPNKRKLESLLGKIEGLHQDVEAKSALLKDLKDKIKENEKAQVEERAEAAAQRMLLEEDAELRKAIQEEERRRLEAENKEMLEQALVDERRKLQTATEQAKAELLKKYAGLTEAASSREQELEMELLQVKADRNMLSLELDQHKKKHELEVENLEREQQVHQQAEKRKALAMFRKFMDGFEEERKIMDAKYRETSKLLQQAVQDIVYLTHRNAELERQLLEAAAWEPVAR